MARNKTPAQPRSLVAAATRLRIERTLTGTIPTETWQQAMWGIYDETPEVWYGLNYKRAVASKMRYYAAEQSDDPEAEPVATDNPQVVEAVEALNEGQGLSQMAGESMLHLDVAGEEYVIGRDTEEGDVTEWAVWSPAEAAADDKLQRELEGPDPTAVALRLWRPHPNKGSKPDSPLRASKDVAEELWYVGAAGRAQSKSRMGAGILFLAQELKISQDASNPNPNDSIADDLGQAMIVPIQDPEGASAVVPIIIEGPRDMIGQGVGWDYLDVAREWTDLGPREERLIRRLAAGIDLPAELILGMGDMNHWGAWLADESSIKSHVDPTVQLFLDGLNRAYLWPYLEEQGFGRAEARRYVIWRDFAHVVQHPDRGKSSLELYDRAELSGEALRQANGFSLDDAPTPEEREIIRQNLGRTSTELIDASNTERAAPAAAVTAAATAPVTLSGLADVDGRALDLLTEAVEAAVQKAMERAGARIRNQTRKEKLLADSIAAADNRQVALTLGRRVALQLVPESDLVTESDFDQLREQATRILTRGQTATATQLETLGADPADSQEQANWLKRAVDFLIGTTLALTIRRLFTADANPDPTDGETGDTAIPAADMWATLTLAGGGETGTPQPDTPRGLALGPDSRRRIADAGYQTQAWEWRYGDASARRTNFPPHEALSGTRFDSWTAPVLESYTSWLAVTHYYPGDHRGCRCQAVPVIVQA